MSRILTVVFGILQIAIGIAAIQLSKSVVDDALSIAGFSAGLLIGVFILGTTNRWVNQNSAMLGLIAGAMLLLFIKFGYRIWKMTGLANSAIPQDVTTPESVVQFLSSIAWPWYPVIGVIATVGTALIIQSLSRQPAELVHSPRTSQDER